MAMTDEKTNTYAMLAREKKARTLAAWLHDEMIRTLEQATPEMWQNAAARAGVNQPSDETRRMVIQILKDRRSI